MNLISWLLVGLLAGSAAKMITPQKESGGWLSSLGIGILGSIVGGFAGSLIGIKGTSLIGSLLIALAGSVIVLFVYHRFISKA